MASAICRGVAFSDTVLLSATGGTFVGKRKKGDAPLYPGASAGSIRILEDVTRMDAASAAKDRVDRALALLERRLLELKSRAAGASRVPDDDLFAPEPSTETDRARIHELEAAGRDAAEALSHAADAIRDSLAEQEAR
jgi:hypothetical protein